MLRPYKLGRITREPDADKGNRLSSRDRGKGIVTIDILGLEVHYLNPSPPFPAMRREGCPSSCGQLGKC